MYESDASLIQQRRLTEVYARAIRHLGEELRAAEQANWSTRPGAFLWRSLEHMGDAVKQFEDARVSLLTESPELRLYGSILQWAEAHLVRDIAAKVDTDRLYQHYQEWARRTLDELPLCPSLDHFEALVAEATGLRVRSGMVEARLHQTSAAAEAERGAVRNARLPVAPARERDGRFRKTTAAAAP